MLFDRGAADALLRKIRRTGNEWRDFVIGGQRRYAQMESVELVLPGFEHRAWTTQVGFFVEDWGMPFGGLLGTRGFLDHWVVTFHKSAGWFQVETPDNTALTSQNDPALTSPHFTDARSLRAPVRP